MLHSSAERFLQATDIFHRYVQRLRPVDETNPTPCTEWNVRDLLNHVVSEQLWVPPLLAGKTVAEIGDQFSGDVLGENPARAWTDAVAGSRAAFSASGALDRTVHLSYGDDTAVNYCDQMTLDALVHGWDFARGLGLDVHMPADLTDWAVHYVEPQQHAMEESGLYGDHIDLTDKADDETRLLGMLGRRI